MEPVYTGSIFNSETHPNTWKKIMMLELCMKKEKSPQSNCIQGVFIIKNDRGLHTRPSTEIVKCAALYQSYISLTYKKTTVNARSILGILMLAAEKGARIKVTAEGDDAQQAVDALLELASKQFNINY